MVEVPEFSFKVTQGTKLLEGDEFPVKGLVISFYLAAAARVIRSSEDEFNAMLLCFSFECF